MPQQGPCSHATSSSQAKDTSHSFPTAPPASFQLPSSCMGVAGPPSAPPSIEPSPPPPPTSGSVTTGLTTLASGQGFKKTFYKRHLPTQTCIPFSSREGREVFQEALAAGHMAGFFKLVEQFSMQDEPAFCGLTSISMVMNALSIDPRRTWKGAWRFFHEQLLDCCRPIDEVKKHGITLLQAASLARCNGAKVDLKRYGSFTLEEFRNDIQRLCQSGESHTVVSYSRRTLQQTGDGHFSPVGGYHAARDLVLILDVARFKYPPHWVSLPMLFEAMSHADPSTKLPRGYLLMSAHDLMESLLLSLDVRTEGWQDACTFLQDRAPKILQQHAGHAMEGVEEALSQLLKAAPISSVDKFLVLRKQGNQASESVSPAFSDSTLFTYLDSEGADMSNAERCIPHSAQQMLLNEIHALPLFQAVQGIMRDLQVALPCSKTTQHASNSATCTHAGTSHAISNSTGLSNTIPGCGTSNMSASTPSNRESASSPNSHSTRENARILNSPISGESVSSPSSSEGFASNRSRPSSNGESAHSPYSHSYHENASILNSPSVGESASSPSSSEGFASSRSSPSSNYESAHSPNSHSYHENASILNSPSFGESVSSPSSSEGFASSRRSPSSNYESAHSPNSHSNHENASILYSPSFGESVSSPSSSEGFASSRSSPSSNGESAHSPYSHSTHENASILNSPSFSENVSSPSSSEGFASSRSSPSSNGESAHSPNGPHSPNSHSTHENACILNSPSFGESAHSPNRPEGCGSSSCSNSSNGESAHSPNSPHSPISPNSPEDCGSSSCSTSYSKDYLAEKLVLLLLLLPSSAWNTAAWGSPEAARAWEGLLDIAGHSIVIAEVSYLREQLHHVEEVIQSGALEAKCKDSHSNSGSGHLHSLDCLGRESRACIEAHAVDELRSRMEGDRAKPDTIAPEPMSFTAGTLAVSLLAKERYWSHHSSGDSASLVLTTYATPQTAPRPMSTLRAQPSAAFVACGDKDLHPDGRPPAKASPGSPSEGPSEARLDSVTASVRFVASPDEAALEALAVAIGHPGEEGHATDGSLQPPSLPHKPTPASIGPITDLKSQAADGFRLTCHYPDATVKGDLNSLVKLEPGARPYTDIYGEPTASVITRAPPDMDNVFFMPVELGASICSARWNLYNGVLGSDLFASPPPPPHTEEPPSVLTIWYSKTIMRPGDKIRMMGPDGSREVLDQPYVLGFKFARSADALRIARTKARGLNSTTRSVATSYEVLPNRMCVEQALLNHKNMSEWEPLASPATIIRTRHLP
eukprot:gene11084-18694_t